VGSDWDPLFKADQNGVLMRRLQELVDGELQAMSVRGGAYVREALCGRDRSCGSWWPTTRTTNWACCGAAGTTGEGYNAYCGRRATRSADRHPGQDG